MLEALRITTFGKSHKICKKKKPQLKSIQINQINPSMNTMQKLARKRIDKKYAKYKLVKNRRDQTTRQHAKNAVIIKIYVYLLSCSSTNASQSTKTSTLPILIKRNAKKKKNTNKFLNILPDPEIPLPHYLFYASKC